MRHILKFKTCHSFSFCFLIPAHHHVDLVSYSIHLPANKKRCVCVVCVLCVCVCVTRLSSYMKKVSACVPLPTYPQPPRKHIPLLSSTEVTSKMKRGQDIQLSICSYVAEKPCGCLYKLTCCNAKFHSLFKCKLYL